MKTRRATSLVELLVVMSVCSVILTLSAAVMHRAMHSHSKARVFADAERNAVRLSHQFRQDVNQGKTAVLEKEALEEGVFLQLALADGQTVKYRQQKNQVLRTLSLKGDKIWREEYAFPEIAQISIRRESSPDRSVLSLTAEAEAGSQGTPAARLTARTVPVVLQVVASVGRDNRYAARQE